MDLGARLEVIERLSRLRDEGALTDDEFADVKANVLSGSAVVLDDSDRDEPPLELVSQRQGYQPEGSPKWLIGAAMLAALLVAAYFVLPMGTDTIENPPLAASSTYEQTSAEAELPSPQSSEVNELEAAANALEAAGNAVEEASEAIGSNQGISGNGHQLTVLSTKPARCHINVPSRDEIVGPCTFKKLSDTEFEVVPSSSGFAAQVILIGHEHHGFVIDGAGTRFDLGPVTQSGACWNNERVDICAWAV